MADTAGEGLVVVDDDGRIVYANESYLALAGRGAATDLRAVERLFTGAPEVSEAIYRLAQAAREHRIRDRGDPPVAGTRAARRSSAGIGCASGPCRAPAGAGRRSGRSRT